MKKVLIPTDGSACSLRAVEAVIAERAQHAEPAGVDIHLVHVEPPLTHEVTRFINPAQLADYRHEQSELALAPARQRLQAAGVPCTCHEAVGHVAEVVAQLAEQLGCDRIVMGTHGRGTLADLLMGSTTLKVIHLAKTPVLLVK